MNTDLRSQRLSQKQLETLIPQTSLFGIKKSTKFVFLLFGLLLMIVLSLIASVLGGYIVTNIGFNYQGSRYVCLGFFTIILISIFTVIRHGILAALVQSIGIGFLFFPMLSVLLMQMGVTEKPESILFGGILLNAIFCGFAILSTVGFAVTMQVLRQVLPKQDSIFQGLFIVLLGAIASVTAVQFSQNGWLLPDGVSVPPDSTEWAALGAILWTIVVVIGGLRLSEMMKRSHFQFLWLKQACIAIASWGGTSFYDLDLSGICFSGANIANSDFRGNNLYRTCLLNVQGLDHARVDHRYLDLDQPKVQKLLTEGTADEKDFQRVNLQGAFLQNATNLEEINFTEANLHGANLQGAKLIGARFVRTRVTSVNFSGADLTGCCIKDWSTNRETDFTGVICNFIYREFEQGKPGDRYPKGRDFEPGEFAALQQQLDDQIELVFQGATDIQALGFAFEKFKLEDDGLGLELQGIEQRGKICIVKVTHNAGISRQQVEQQVKAEYQLILETKDREIARLAASHVSQQSIIQDLVTGVVKTPGKVFIQGEGNRVYMVQQSGDIMEGQHINAKGNVDTSSGAKVTIGGDVTGSTLNLGTISGNVSNLIQQLRESPMQGSKDIAQILGELQNTIQAEAQLSEPQKQDALEAVATLGEEAKKPPENRTAKLCTMAMNALKGVTSTLSDASQLAEVVKNVLPVLKGLLGIS